MYKPWLTSKFWDKTGLKKKMNLNQFEFFFVNVYSLVNSLFFVVV